MATHIKFAASVSFEFDLQPVLTVRQEIAAASAAKAASRAVQAARKAFPGTRPRSIVVVLEVLERVEGVAGKSRGFGKRRAEVEGVAV